MSKFVELNEAAVLLGLTNDQLVEMRSNGEIHGYRDGAVGSSSWKKLNASRRKGPLAASRAVMPLYRPSTISAAVSIWPTMIVNRSWSARKNSAIPVRVLPARSLAKVRTSRERSLVDCRCWRLRLEVGFRFESGYALTLDEPKPGKGGSSALKLTPGMSSDLTLVPDPGSDKAMKAAAAAGSDLHVADSGLELKSAVPAERATWIPRRIRALVQAILSWAWTANWR